MDAVVQLCTKGIVAESNTLIDVSSDGSVLLFNDSTAHLCKADGRLLQMPSASLLEAQCYELRLQRDGSESSLDNFVCHGLKAHPRAAFVLLYGILPVRVGRTHVVLLVDTNAAGAKGMPKPPSTGSKPSSGPAIIVQRLNCLARFVDHARIAANGLEVLQVSWHQHSGAHFAVLTSDNAFSVFSVRQLSTPEQLFKISPLSPSATFSLVDLALEDCVSGPQEFVSFTFGSTCGWDALMVYFMTRSGEVFSLGPIAPFGSLLKSGAVLALKRDCQDDPTTLEWLQVATGHPEVSQPLPQLLEKDMWRVSSTVVIQPHSLAGRVLALKGPIVSAAQRGAVFSSMCLLSEKLPRAEAAAAGVEGFTAVVLAGVPGTHAYVSVGLIPAVPLPEWGPGEPLAESDGSGHGTVTHVIQRVTKVVPDCDDPAEPLDNLQLQLPDRCTASFIPADQKPAPHHGRATSTAYMQQLRETVWMHAPRQHVSPIGGGHLEPMLMMCLGGSFWRLYVHALPALASRITDATSGLPDASQAAGTPLGRAGTSVASSVVGGADGIASSTVASPTARSRAARGGPASPRLPRLPRSRLQELAVPLPVSTASNGSSAGNSSGLRCVRMFWNALVGDVGIVQHTDGNVAMFPADDLVAGSLGDNTTFWGAPSVSGPPDGCTANTGPSSLVPAGGGGPQQPTTKKRPASGSTAGGGASSSLGAGEKVVGGVADESLLASEQAMQAAYYVHRPELPRPSRDVPAGSNPSEVSEALTSDAAALMATGAAYCEHAHAVLMSRFRKVAEELDKNTHAAEVSDVQRQLENIVKVNSELRKRINNVSEAKSNLAARTDALCNATLLNSSFQRCGLNSAEEAACTHLNRIEDSLDGLRRRTADTKARVGPLMQPKSQPSTTSTSALTLQGVGSMGARPFKPVGAALGPSSDRLQGGVAIQPRTGVAGPLRMSKSGKTYTGLGSGWKCAPLFGGVDAAAGDVAGTRKASAARNPLAQNSNVPLNVGLNGRGGGYGGKAGALPGTEMSTQQMENLKGQVGVIEQQLEQLRQLQGEVVALCDETARQYG